MIEYKDFSRRLDSTVKEKGKEIEKEHYEWYHAQGVRLKTRYRPSAIRRGGK